MRERFFTIWVLCQLTGLLFSNNQLRAIAPLELEMQTEGSVKQAMVNYKPLGGSS